MFNFTLIDFLLPSQSSRSYGETLNLFLSVRSGYFTVGGNVMWKYNENIGCNFFKWRVIATTHICVCIIISFLHFVESSKRRSQYGRCMFDIMRTYIVFKGMCFNVFFSFQFIDFYFFNAEDNYHPIIISWRRSGENTTHSACVCVLLGSTCY